MHGPRSTINYLKLYVGSWPHQDILIFSIDDNKPATTSCAVLKKGKENWNSEA